MSPRVHRSRDRSLSKGEAIGIISLDKFESIIKTLRKGTWKQREETAKLIGRRRYHWTIPFLIDGLKWRGDKARNTAIKTLVDIGSSSIPPLIGAFKDVARGPRIRSAAATCLGLLRVRKAIPELVRGLSDHNVSVRLSSMVALYRLNYRRAASNVIGMLDDESGAIRVNAARILGTWRERRAASRLIGALSDEKWYIRQNSAQALGKIGGSKAKSALTELLNDSRKAVRRAATESLELIGES